jgi:hypothetical protein
MYKLLFISCWLLTWQRCENLDCFRKFNAFIPSNKGSRGSPVGIATGYGLDDRGVGSSSPGMAKNFLHAVQTGSGVHTTSHSMGTVGKAAGA